ncbi:hypothetical protein Tco_0654086 [Tanacetum coccineum]|uniref:Uncharacterized protein n=1 Tax=Tanacetum coccineum TaxID=301880 RepID=A0ABQ4X2F8_9ASTR
MLNIVCCNKAIALLLSKSLEIYLNLKHSRVGSTEAFWRKYWISGMKTTYHNKNRGVVSTIKSYLKLGYICIIIVEIRFVLHGVESCGKTGPVPEARLYSQCGCIFNPLYCVQKLGDRDGTIEWLLVHGASSSTVVEEGERPSYTGMFMFRVKYAKSDLEGGTNGMEKEGFGTSPELRLLQRSHFMKCVTLKLCVQKPSMVSSYIHRIGFNYRMVSLSLLGSSSKVDLIRLEASSVDRKTFLPCKFESSVNNKEDVLLSI